jgi:hypothetical protein
VDDDVRLMFAAIPTSKKGTLRFEGRALDNCGTTETAFTQLLNGEQPLQDLQHVAESVALLREVNNYGSNLLPRCFQNIPGE